MTIRYGFYQSTIADDVLVSGFGLHSGAPVSVRLIPAPADHGIRFVRSDLGTKEIPAHVDYVLDSTLATTIGLKTDPEYSVATVEHLLAALRGLGIDNATVFVEGPELPILDGSAGEWVAALLEVGVKRQRKARRFLRPTRKIEVSEEGGKHASLSPASHLQIRCAIDFDHPLILNRPFELKIDEKSFAQQLAPARTFGFLKDVEAMQAAGLAKGGSLENAIVIDQYRVLNPEGLRFADEFVRHKILDAIGDLALCGGIMLANVDMARTGHALNARLLEKLLSDPKNYEWVSAEAIMPKPVRSRSRVKSLETSESLL